MERSYSYYKKAFEGQEKPFAFVDLEYFDVNIKDILTRAKDKKIRIASKSIRCVSLIKRVLDYSPQYQGIMCFTAKEAIWLSSLGFDDLLVAYPTYNPTHIQAVAELVKQGKKIYLMTDLIEHLDQIDKVGRQVGVQIPICMDLDMSSKFPGLYFGVYRSTLNSLEAVEKYLKLLPNFSFVTLKGVMGYEAQIAGLGNNFKGQTVKNIAIGMLQNSSIKEIATRRTKAVQLVKDAVGELDFVNGGGTGSMEITRKEEEITEIAVGSGFFTPTLFDNYGRFKHLPSAGYAIEIVRQPQEDIYTCMGGGYVASGALGEDKIPTPYLPKGCELYTNEMAGEVQTPIIYKGTEKLSLGDPIFMRHSKAGELCERFNEILILDDGKVVEKTPTYRGEGKCFL